jgi:hypothetical protein
MGEEPVDVTNGEFNQFLPPKDWQDMHTYNRLVIAKGAGRNLMAHDVLEPSLEEFDQRHVCVLDQKPIVDVTSDLLQLLDNFGSVLRRDVFPYRFAGGGVTEMSHAHPKPV